MFIHVYGPMVPKDFEGGKPFLRREKGHILTGFPSACVAIGIDRSLMDQYFVNFKNVPNEVKPWKNPEIHKAVEALKEECINIDVHVCPLKELSGELLSKEGAFQRLFGPYSADFREVFSRPPYV